MGEDSSSPQSRTDLPTLEVTQGSAEPAAELRRGSEVGRYVVLETLGRGGMGVVYRAYDPRLRRELALKLLRRYGGGDLDIHAEARLIREAQAMARLSHPNVLPVYDVERTTHGVCIAMEFVDGRTLSQWLRETSPTPRRILEVFREAAEGLAAAHDAGLVHRDFKPSNVLVESSASAHARVRVMDFGVATFGEADDHDDDPLPTSLGSHDSVSVAGPLTHVGSVIGTPAYMAPEYQQGRTADARSDQYAFCVALFEALAGERPFAAESFDALREAKARAEIRWPATSVVPTWIRRILQRGLDPRPERRFATMRELESALAHDPARQRRRVAGAAAAAGLIGLTALVVWNAGAEDACSGSEAELAGIWDDARRAEVDAAIRGTAVAHVEDTAPRVRERLDAYAGAWVEQHRAACTATHVRKDQSHELLDLRMACLMGRRGRLQALVDVLAIADRGVADRAVAAIVALPALDPCGDREYLLARIKPPADPDVAERVEALRERLRVAQALGDAGKATEAAAIRTEVLDAARDLDYRPMLAEALLASGKDGSGEGTTAAIDRLEEAYFVALASDHEEAAFEASYTLVFALGQAGRYDEARRWSRPARAHVDRRPGPKRESLLANALGAMAAAEGRIEESVEHLERALAATRELGESRLAQARMLGNLGAVLVLAGDNDAAGAAMEEALEISQEELGPTHPTLAPLLSNLAVLHGEAKEYDRALDLLRQTLELDRRAHGDDSPTVETTRHNIAAMLLQQGKSDDARELFAEVLAQRIRLLGPDHRDVCFTELGLGDALVQTKRYPQALPHLERALTIGSSVGLESVALAGGKFGLAQALWATDGDRARALQLARDAADTYAAAGPNERAAAVEVRAWVDAHR